MNNSAPVLLAEDDENDILFFEMAYKKAGLVNPLVVVRDGKEAIRYLDGDGIYADRKKYPMPALVFLDIKMPIMTGFDVLEWLQRRSGSIQLVVVVLTSSANPEDIGRAMSLGAAEYLTKPTNTADLLPMLRTLQARWLSAE